MSVSNVNASATQPTGLRQLSRLVPGNDDSNKILLGAAVAAATLRKPDALMVGIGVAATAQSVRNLFHAEGNAPAAQVIGDLMGAQGGVGLAVSALVGSAPQRLTTCAAMIGGAALIHVANKAMDGKSVYFKGAVSGAILATAVHAGALAEVGTSTLKYAPITIVAAAGIFAGVELFRRHEENTNAKH